MDTCVQDVRFGLRALWRNKGVTTIALLTLALGIGANSAVFALVNAALLRPLPYPQADELVHIQETLQGRQVSVSLLNFADWQKQNSVFEGMLAARDTTLTMTGRGEPERVAAREVTANAFATLAVTPLVGRGFSDAEDRPGAERVAVLGEGFWRRAFAGNAGALGRSVVLDGEPHTIIGVMPARYFGQDVDVYTPLGRRVVEPGFSQRQNRAGTFVIARLKQGVDARTANAEMIGIAERLAKEYPATNAAAGISMLPLRERMVGDVRQALLLLMGAVSLVLLIACANVANLLLGRATARRQEVAIRTALGASRARLVRQLLTESSLLSVGGASLGLALAYVILQGAAAFADVAPGIRDAAIDSTVLAFTLLVALATGMIFGILPALQASRSGAAGDLKEGGRGLTAARASHWTRNLLVVGETALAVVLVIGAGLLLRSLSLVLNADPGLRTEGIATARFSLPASRFDDDAKRTAYVSSLLERVRALPGVQSAGVVNPLPLSGAGSQTRFLIAGRPVPELAQIPSTDRAVVSPQYFETAGIRLLRGRFFTDQDTAEAPRVCVIDETMARTYWPDENPVGMQMAFRNPSLPAPQWMTIVGVVAHVKTYGVDRPSRVETYTPLLQTPASAMTLLVRSSRAPASLSGELRDTARAVDADVPLYAVRPFAEVVGELVASRRLTGTMLGAFAALALVLGAVGVFGVMSHAVAQRTHELGVRIALGATPRNILSLIFGHGMGLVGAGLAVGVGGALALTHYLRTLLGPMLFGLSGRDPVTFLIVPLVLALVASLACYIPARRAMRVSPMVALRSE